MLETRNLSLTINNKSLLTNVNINLESKQIVSVLGANGSGKTTLLRCLSGIEKNFLGQINFQGRDLKSANQIDIAKVIAYLPQELFLPPLIKVKEFLELSIVDKERLKAEGKTASQKAAEVAAIYRLEPLLESDMQSISGGERQRVKIASVHIQDSPVILFDEPQSFLDPAGVSELWNMLIDLKEQHNKLIVVSTHDVGWSISKSDVLLCLKNGAIYRNLVLKDTTDQEVKRTLEAIYEVDVMFS